MFKSLVVGVLVILAGAESVTAYTRWAEHVRALEWRAVVQTCAPFPRPPRFYKSGHVVRDVK